MFMKFYVCLLFCFFLFTMCSDNKDQILQQISNAEYLRDSTNPGFKKWLSSENPEIREQAVKALGRIQDESSIPEIANLLKDINKLVRREAVFALGQTFSSKAEQYLLTALPKERDYDIQVEYERAHLRRPAGRARWSRPRRRP